MIDIADLSEVSRATLYNHFRDKDAVLYSLLSREVIRLFENAPKNPAEVLEYTKRGGIPLLKSMSAYTTRVCWL
jgi:AcrR family transcriptional regulator